MNIINATTRFAGDVSFRQMARFIEKHSMDPFVRIGSGDETLLSESGIHAHRAVEIFEAAIRVEPGAAAFIGIELDQLNVEEATIYVDPELATHLHLTDTPATVEIARGRSFLMVQFAGMSMSDSIAECRPWGVA